ncbi:hypothetical protein APHAL10511_006177 [Amanita phalloides]|nr:hypothetical protein APHAL10511_006177 [Amanita phalloides]
MSTSKKQKATQRRPVISQPRIEDAATQAFQCSFSPDGDLFALLSLAVDKHRLRVFDTLTNQSTAEYILESARANSLAWAHLGLSISEDIISPSAKKRRRKVADSAENSIGNNLIRVVILGLSDGTVLLFSPLHGRVVRKLSHPSSTTAVLCMTVCNTGIPTLWTSSSDGAIRIWDVRSGNILSYWKTEDRVPFTSMAPCPIAVDTEDQCILFAHHSIQLLALDVKDLAASKQKQLGSFTGHTSHVNNLEWDMSKSSPERFYSSAEGDRFIYVWQLPKDGVVERKPLLSISLDSAVSTFMLLQLKTGPGGLILAVLSVSGKVSFFHIPDEITVPVNPLGHADERRSTLFLRSQISISSKTGGSMAKIISISSIQDRPDCIRISRLLNGIRPVFSDVRYLDNAGDFIQKIVIEDIDNSASENVQQPIYSKRYVENANVTVRSGVELGREKTSGDEMRLDGDLDVDLAELSLGQRLAAVSGEDRLLSGSDKSDSDSGPKSKTSKQKIKGGGIPANSLTRTLIQALHSSDSRLLETCLAHSDPALISNTVRRLPAQLAIPLINSCADRLGKGARSANMKGRGGGASSQRGTTLVIWISTVLATHGGHLMTIPDLVAKLSGLHAILTTRLSLQQSLLSLTGRLELVLSQMQMRSAAASVPLLSKNERSSRVQLREVTKYVEGDSEESENEEQLMDIEDDVNDDASIEDVELAASVDSEEEEASDSEDEDDMAVNGFIDDEAEEYSEDDSVSE